MIDYHITALSDAISSLRQHPQIEAALSAIREQQAPIINELRVMVLAQIENFAESANPEALLRLDSHGTDQLAEVLRLLGGGALDELSFVQAHARWSATERFPLEVNLHVYRCGHRVYMGRIRDALRAVTQRQDQTDSVDESVSDFCFEYTDAISTVLTRTYLEQVTELSALAQDREAELMNVLLDGYDESDARVASILRRAGYLSQRHSFCVLIAQSVDANEMANPERARRLAIAIDACVNADIARSLIDIRDGRVICVYAAVRRVSGWTPETGSLASRISTKVQNLGTAVLVGISSDARSTSQVPGAVHQASIALQTAGVDRRVVEFQSVPLRELMIHLSSRQLPSLMPPWAGALYQADDRSRGALQRTLAAYAQANMNALKAAARLEVHPNTIYARFQKVRELAGLDPRSFDQLNDLLTVFHVRVRN